MSIHERVFEGTLAWPLYMNGNGINCRAPTGKSLPPWGLDEDAPWDPENMCGVTLIGQDFLDLGDIRTAIEKHVNEAHGGLV